MSKTEHINHITHISPLRHRVVLSSSSMAKRKPDSPEPVDHCGPSKRVKGPDVSTHGTTASSDASVVQPGPTQTPNVSQDATRKAKTRAPKAQTKANDVPRKAHKVRKLVPPRPFPTVPASVSATGPRSAHTDGKNYICITRRTELGAYLRRCKDVFLKDG